MRHFICLSSDANIETFPSNTPNNFINLLPEPIENKGEGKYYLKVKSVGLSIYGEGTTDTSSYIKIHILEIKEQIQGNDFTHFAGGFTYPPKDKYTYYYGLHTFKRSPNLELKFQYLSQLHVILTNENDKQITLPTAFPTLVWIELSDMTPEHEFTMTCLSSQPLLYPGNTLAQFISPVRSELHLANFEVAVLQVVFPPRMKEVSTATLTVGRNTWKFDLGQMYSTEDFIQAVKAKLRHSTYKADVVFGIQDATDHEHDGQIFFARKDNALTQRRGQIWIEPDLTFSRICGTILNYDGGFFMKPGKVHFF